jgi:hypothetical protein
MVGDTEDRPACPRAAAVEAADAHDAVRALRLALHAARITLPDLHPDSRRLGGHVPAGPLVDLGSVHPDVALELAELICEGALHAADARARAARV